MIVCQKILRLLVSLTDHSQVIKFPVAEFPEMKIVYGETGAAV